MTDQPNIPVANLEAVQKPKARRGFAAMSPEQQREIASRGGRSAHNSQRAHRFTSEEARAAVLKKNAARIAAREQAA